jgi:hypothetical protein
MYVVCLYVYYLLVVNIVRRRDTHTHTYLQTLAKRSTIMLTLQYHPISWYVIYIYIYTHTHTYLQTLAKRSTIMLTLQYHPISWYVIYFYIYIHTHAHIYITHTCISNYLLVVNIAIPPNQLVLIHLVRFCSNEIQSWARVPFKWP